MENYQIVSKIGQGNYGLVHLVRRVSDNEWFALKRVNLDVKHDRENSEIQVLKTLNNPFVVQYHDSFIEKD